ncbi:SMEK domain-containing protein [Flavobacterium kingsejongi]|uniref:SMEK domain-containing protein n=1 Tax=Flavobacterium kingsejongi TaxID=1678728 RepID=A0A2S1LPD9_9FLAO|nr:SMEK domain-containing protein [Flavobacterium kingsejongi]AWG25589.1 hypothetical protein FK004_10280 [Flavobacterium kingsejongi]
MSRSNLSIITEALSHIANKVDLHNHLNLQDINILLENFFRDILNIIYKDRKFKNLNSVEGNFASIDLGDNIKDLAIQVTSTTSLAKVRKTIEKYKEEYDYKKIVMLYAKMDKPSRSKDINEESGDKIEIEEWSIKDLCNKINDLEDEDILEIQKIVLNQITPSLYDNYSKNEDTSATKDYDNLEQKDIRNFSDKFIAVCPSINQFRLIKYSRDIASGEAELSKFSERQIRSMKYRIFEVCQEELIDFCEQNDMTNRSGLNFFLFKFF